MFNPSSDLCDLLKMVRMHFFSKIVVSRGRGLISKSVSCPFFHVYISYINGHEMALEMSPRPLGTTRKFTYDPWANSRIDQKLI